MPLTNLQDRDLGTIARSAGSTLSNTQILFDLGVIRTVGGIALGPTNLTPGSQYRVTSYDDAAMTDLLYDSGIKEIPGTTVDSLDLEWENPGFWYGIEDPRVVTAPWIIEVIPEDQLVSVAAQHWKIEIFDTGNADGFVEIGYAMIGQAFRPSLNFDENNSFGRVQLTDTVEALGGHRDYWHRGSRRTMRVTWWRLDEPEGWGDIYRMMTRMGIHEPMFIVQDPDDLENIQKRSFLATFRSTPELRLIIADGVTTGFEVEEML